MDAAEAGITFEGYPLSPEDDWNSVIRARYALGDRDFLVQPGVHREHSMNLRQGGVFLHDLHLVGLPGAVVLGSRDLTTGWTQGTLNGATAWYQDQTFLRDQIAQEFDGWGVPYDSSWQGSTFAEEMFVNGWNRFRRKMPTDVLGPGQFCIAYDSSPLGQVGTHRIWIGENPATKSSIEVSLAPYLFAGSGVRNLLVENLEIAAYATPSQYGVIGGYFALNETDRHLHESTMRFCTVHHCHGSNVRMGPGAVVEHCEIYAAGCLGVKGEGRDNTHNDWQDNYDGSRPMRLANNNIHDNTELMLSVSSNYEEFGPMKFSFSYFQGGDYALEIVNNWIHDEEADGIWLDGYANRALVQSNLIERVQRYAMHYEVCDGPALFRWNEIRYCGLGPFLPPVNSAFDKGIAMIVVNSRDGVIEQNLAYGNRAGTILVYAQDREVDAGPMVIRKNDQQFSLSYPQTSGQGGRIIGSRPPSDLDDTEFYGNTYRLGSVDDYWVWETTHNLTSAQWRALGHDPTSGETRGDGTNAVYLGNAPGDWSSPALEGAIPYEKTHYGVLGTEPGSPVRLITVTGEGDDADPATLTVAQFGSGVALEWSLPVMEEATHVAIFRREGITNSVFDPLVDVEVGRVPVGITTFFDGTVEPGGFTYQVFPVAEV